jgi:hypothetical protein
MNRDATPLHAADLSAFARALAAQLAGAQQPPGHQTLMNMLARAAGHRNLHAMQAAYRLPPPAAAREAPTEVALPLTPAARKALAQFDAAGRLARWPTKHSVQRLALWVLWTCFDARRVYTEREVNDVLRAWHSFGDHATLRRELVDMRLLARKSDCSEYRKLPARPGDEARALIQAWRRRAGEPGAPPARQQPRPRAA